MKNTTWMAAIAAATSLLGCGGAAGPGATGPVAVATVDRSLLASGPTMTADPATTLLTREREVWLLEGRLLAEAEATLRAPAAAAALGDARALRATDRAEQDVRAYLRAARSPEARAAARTLVASLNRASRTMLDAVTAQTGVAAEDVFMDYLTYDALLDLAMMRYGHARHRAGGYAGDAATLAASFFGATTQAPSASLGIQVLASEADRLELSVFGGKVEQRVLAHEVLDTPAVGRVGRVTWQSSYEQVRAAGRGQPAGELVEELEFDGGSFRLDYARELDEYLAWNSTNPWATTLYLSSADAVADSLAGVAAVGGLEAGAAVRGDLGALPRAGALGASGARVTVVGARAVPRLGAAHARRGHFLVVTLAVDNPGATEVHAPAAWFRLATATAEYPELGVGRPGLAPSVLATAPPRARMLTVPHTTLAPKSKGHLVLVFDVPTTIRQAALLLGGDVVVVVEVK